MNSDCDCVENLVEALVSMDIEEDFLDIDLEIIGIDSKMMEIDKLNVNDVKISEYRITTEIETRIDRIRNRIDNFYLKEIKLNKDLVNLKKKLYIEEINNILNISKLEKNGYITQLSSKDTKKILELFLKQIDNFINEIDSFIKLIDLFSKKLNENKKILKENEKFIVFNREINEQKKIYIKGIENYEMDIGLFNKILKKL